MRGFKTRIEDAPIDLSPAWLLPKVNPQADYRREQEKAEDDVDASFGSSLVRRFAQGRANHGGFDLVVDGCEGQSGKPFAVGSFAHQADCDQDDRADYEHENRVVQEVHIDDPAGGGRFEMAAAGTIGKLEDEPRGSHHKASQKGRDRPQSIQARPQDSEDKAGSDGRADISLDALEVNVEFAADAVNERNPQQTQQHHEAGRDAAEIDELPLGGLGADLLVEIQSYQGRSRVEHRAHRAHHRRKQGGHHQTHEAGGQEIEDQCGVGKIRLLHLVGKQREGDNAGQDKHEHGQDLEETRENGARFGVSFIARREDALHNHLVGAPVPNAEDRRTKEDSRPRELRIGRRFYHVEVAGRNHRPQVVQTSYPVETNDGQRNRTGNQNQGLNRVCVDDRSQSAGNGVNSGGDDQNHSRLPQGPASNTFQNDAGGVELHGDLGKDVGDDRDGSQVYGALTVEPSFQEFRHRKDVRAQVKGHENPAQDQQDQAGQPLKMAYGQSGRGAGARQANEVLGGDIRYKQGCPDEEPADVPAGEKVVFRGAFLSREVHSDAKNDSEVDSNDD